MNYPTPLSSVDQIDHGRQRPGPNWDALSIDDLIVLRKG